MTSRTISRPIMLEQIETMKPGERLIYHTGHLMYDRALGQNFLVVNATACAAWDAMEAGKVRLVQRAVHDSLNFKEFEYSIIKRAAPYKPVGWWGCYATSKFKYSKPCEISKHPAPAMPYGKTPQLEIRP